VATPCPLIIAAPVAIAAGVSRIARAGVILKGGAVLESLSRVRVLLFDKTGTLTSGNPVVKEVVAASGMRTGELLMLAASIDQVSSHPLATALRNAAKARRLSLTSPTNVEEAHGDGIRGRIGRHQVALGKAEFVGITGGEQAWVRQIRRRALLESMTTVFLSVDGKMGGVFLLADGLRADASRTIRVLRRAGIDRVVMVTGDHPDVAHSIAAAVGLDAVMAEHSPQEKAIAVGAEAAAYGPVAYVGDGINDAPALATADVGIAVGSRGISAASETADAVLMGDRLDPLAVAIRGARRSRAIAIQSIAVGMGLSTLAMLAAVAGLLAPVAGAILQEGIDLVVILNALRALSGAGTPRVSAEMTSLSARLQEEHRQLQDGIDHLRVVADQADAMDAATLHAALGEIVEFVQGALLPHELVEERRFYPLVAQHIGGDDPTAAMMRGHVEIARLSRLIVEAAQPFEQGQMADSELADIRRLLYSLHAVLTLHNAQEEEAYLSLAPPTDPRPVAKASA
jgi:soluble P-type ATPase